jgi:hypothetical protein
MPVAVIIIFFLIATLHAWIKWTINKKKDFKNVLIPELKRYGLRFISSEYPGLFKVGPFKKFEIHIGKPQINNGAIQYEKTYYRKVTVLTPDNISKEVWAKIETGWFKETSVEFIPDLKEINDLS